MKTPIVVDMLASVRQTAGDRLDKLGDSLPDERSRVPFEQYIAHAQQLAPGHPEFAQELRRSFAQYRAVGG